ncbi:MULTISPECIES: helix-turn-helix domain-containing protein [unclassified Methylococcus]|uniref:helix-turn-helix domain-containing protein n=1 Tax=unclassified Methylococcus TaxID=2618889 RepID=UPI003D7C4DFA
MSKTSTQKKPVPEDWHPADIVAALHKTGQSLRQLALEHGYKSGGTLSAAMIKPYPKAEAIIAKAIGVKPEQIWPSRYGDGGKRPYRGWAARCMHRARQHSESEPARNAEVSEEV